MDARTKYLVHVANMFKLIGYDEATAKAAAQTVFGFGLDEAVAAYLGPGDWAPVRA